MNKIDAIMKDINEWRDIPIKWVSQETRIKSILEKHLQEPTEEREVEITIEEIKDRLWESEDWYSDNLDRTFDGLLGKLVYYWFLKKEDCDFIAWYKIDQFED